jgi:hypothetical protein
MGTKGHCWISESEHFDGFLRTRHDGKGFMAIWRALRVSRAAAALFLALLAATGPAMAGGPGWDGGFERLYFRVAWSFVPAGTAIIQARPLPADAAELRIEACTNDALDLVHKVRDRIRARVGMGEKGLRARRYRITQREGDYRGDRRLVFDEVGVVRTRDLKKGQSDYYPVPPGTVDVLTALFETRRRPLADGASYRIPVFDDDESYELVVEVEGRERLDTVLGEETPVVRVRPRLQSEGVFQRKGELRVWFTDDRRRIPVRMESEIAIGAVNARLERIQHRPPASGKGDALACE